MDVYFTSKMIKAIKTLDLSKVKELCDNCVDVKKEHQEIDKCWGILLQEKALLSSEDRVEKFVSIIDYFFKVGVYAKNKCGSVNIKDNSEYHFLDEKLSKEIFDFESTDYLCKDLHFKQKKDVERNANILMYNLIWYGYFDVAKCLNERLEIPLTASMVCTQAGEMGLLANPVYYALLSEDIRYIKNLIKMGAVEYKKLGKMTTSGSREMKECDLLQVMANNSSLLERYGNVLVCEQYGSFGSFLKREKESFLDFKEFLSNLMLNSNLGKNNKNCENFLDIIAKKGFYFGLFLVFKILEENGLLIEVLGGKSENKTVAFFMQKRLEQECKKRSFDEMRSKCLLFLVEKIKMYNEVVALSNITKEVLLNSTLNNEKCGFAGLIEQEASLKERSTKGKSGAMDKQSKVPKGGAPKGVSSECRGEHLGGSGAGTLPNGGGMVGESSTAGKEVKRLRHSL